MYELLFGTKARMRALKQIIIREKGTFTVSVVTLETDRIGSRGMVTSLFRDLLKMGVIEICTNITQQGGGYTYKKTDSEITKALTDFIILLNKKTK